MYYRYDETYKITEKSETLLLGLNVCKSHIDFDLNLYTIVIGLLSENEAVATILYHTESIKPAEQLVRYIQEETTRSMLTDIDIDFRLSLIELGL